MIVQYSMKINVTGKSVFGCPEGASIKMKLFPQEDINLFSQGLAQSDWAGIWPDLGESESKYWIPIDKAANSDIDQFYDAFRESSDKCLVTPINIWPDPSTL